MFYESDRKTADQIMMKILPKMYLWMRKILSSIWRFSCTALYYLPATSLCYHCLLELFTAGVTALYYLPATSLCYHCLLELFTAGVTALYYLPATSLCYHCLLELFTAGVTALSKLVPELGVNSSSRS